MTTWAWVCVLLLAACCSATTIPRNEVFVEKLVERAYNPEVTGAWTYESQVTMYIENPEDGSFGPPLWSTRPEHGGDGAPYYVSLTQEMMPGFRIGIQQVREGEHARIHIPPDYGLGWDDFQRGGIVVPAGSYLCFDIELQNGRQGFRSDSNIEVSTSGQNAKTKKEQAKAAN